MLPSLQRSWRRCQHEAWLIFEALGLTSQLLGKIFLFFLGFLSGKSQEGNSSSYASMNSNLRKLAHKNWLFSVSNQPKVHSFLSWGRMSEILQLAALYPLLPLESNECLPLTLQQAMVGLLVILENQIPPPKADPNYHAHHVEGIIEESILHEDFWKYLLKLPFAIYPFFGCWLHMQRLVTHRFELPALSTTQLPGFVFIFGLSSSILKSSEDFFKGNILRALCRCGKSSRLAKAFAVELKPGTPLVPLPQALPAAFGAISRRSRGGDVIITTVSGCRTCAGDFFLTKCLALPLI